MSVEKEFMNEAIRLAIKSYEEDEVPVGAVVVKDLIESGTYVGSPAKKIK